MAGTKIRLWKQVNDYRYKILGPTEIYDIIISNCINYIPSEIN